MRRLHAWITGAAGGVAAYRLFRRQRRGDVDLAEPDLSDAEPEERAEALRAKLAELREQGKETPVEPGEDDTLEERRRRVHEEGRAAVDEMQDE